MPTYPIHGSKYFDIREFVDERTWKAMGVKAACLIEVRTVRVADLVRLKSGLITVVNNWHFAEPGEPVYKASGYRAPWEKVGGQLSQHRRGCAEDLKVLGLRPKQVFELVMDNADEFEEAGLTTIEALEFTPSWLHLDGRPRIPGWHQKKGFLIVKP